MNWFSLLSEIFDGIASKQGWANSDKFGGALHILVPLADNTFQHLTMSATPAGTKVINVLGNHPTVSAGWQAAEAMGASLIMQFASEATGNAPAPSTPETPAEVVSQ